MTKFYQKLKELGACPGAIEWAGDKTLRECWNTCERGDWMLWLYAKLYPGNLRELTLAKAHCANTVRHLMSDERSKNAVDVAIAFGEGRATRKELDFAVTAADYVAAAADGAAAYAAAVAAATAANVDDAATAAAYAAAVSAAIKENENLTANICRKYLKIEGSDR